MKRFYAWLLVLTTVAFAACDSGSDKEAGSDIQLAPGVSKNLTLYADQTSAADGDISFTTTGPWRATIAETRSEVDWITLSSDHGDAAGDYTIRITLGVNTSGADRKAIITIECGATKITITVEQKATTAEGEIPGEGGGVVPDTPEKLVAQILYSYEDSSYQERETIDFTYDALNRLVEVEDVCTENGSKSDSRKFLYEYGDGVINVTTVYSSKDNSFKDESESYTAYLNEAGYVIRAVWSDGSTNTYTYDKDNQLIRVDSYGERAEYVWENGNLVESRYYYDKNGSQPYSTNTYAYCEDELRENIDFYYDFFSWDEELGLLGRLGVLNRNRLKSVRSQDGKDDLDVTYTLDSEGCVTKYSQQYSPTSTPRVYTVTYYSTAR